MPPDVDERSAHTFTLTVNGQSYHTADESPSGHNIRRIAGFIPPSDYVLIRVKRPGTISIGLDETVDLSGHGAEEFRGFESDRDYSFTVDEIGYEWGDASIGEADLRHISATPADHDLYLEQSDKPDRLIDAHNPVDLSQRGSERIRSHRTETTIIVNGEAHTVAGREISFEQLFKLAFPTPPVGTNILITIDYGKGPERNPKGSLMSGHSVWIKNGMVFDVTATDRS